jgi:hypothetical protein
MKATQLALFDERTRKDLEQLQYDHAWLKERLETAKVEYRKLRQERDTLTTQVQTLKDRCVDAMAQRDQLRREHEAAQRVAQHWKAMYDLALMRRPTVPAPAAPPLEPTLKRLLTIAHPDRWAQGQDATALAHELAVVINALRAEVQG